MTITSFEEWLEQIDTDSEDISVDRYELYKVVREGFEAFDGPSRPELLWRMSRAAFKVAGAAELTKDVAKQKKFLAEAEEWGKKALELEPNEPDAHLWMANVYGKMSDHLGTKDRIGKGKEVQHHLDACVKNRPEDFNAYYTYGRWCIEVAKLSWLERKLATAIFDKPPEATFEDAIEKFAKVDTLKPGWRANSFWTGKSYTSMKNYKEAFKAFDLAMAMEIKDEEDQLVEEELQQLHKKYASYK